jgi:hypothetical protein
VSVGEGIGFAGVVAIAFVLVVAGLNGLGRAIGASIERWPASAEDSRAEAMVPEYAAASRPPEYRGRCRCRGCRNRPKEPCSDYDGD